MRFYKVPGYGLKVTNDGSCVIDTITNKIKTQWDDKNGYKYIMVTKEDGSNTTAKVHRLVARVFHGKCPKGKEVNHKNLIKYDNHYKNLEYLTSKGNKDHAVRNGVKYGASVTPIYSNRILSSKQVRKIRKLYATGKYTQKQIAKMFNVGKDAIHDIVNYSTYIVGV
jgi:hypothetical protein